MIQIDPKRRRRALKALAMTRRGISGKEIAKALGCPTARAAQDLAGLGGTIEAVEDAILTEAEMLLIVAIGDILVDGLMHGYLISAKSADVSRRARRGAGWAASASKRLRASELVTAKNRYEPHRLIRYSCNGYMNLTPAGWAVYAVMRP